MSAAWISRRRCGCVACTAKYWLTAARPPHPTCMVPLADAANLLSSREPYSVAVHATGRIRTDSNLCRRLLRIRHLLRDSGADGGGHRADRRVVVREAADF